MHTGFSKAVLHSILQFGRLSVVALVVAVVVAVEVTVVDPVVLSSHCSVKSCFRQLSTTSLRVTVFAHELLGGTWTYPPKVHSTVPSSSGDRLATFFRSEFIAAVVPGHLPGSTSLSTLTSSEPDNLPASFVTHSTVDTPGSFAQLARLVFIPNATSSQSVSASAPISVAFW